jgi:GntR family transcriptional repressor for pyruvate dehydrogenase complex
VAGSELFETIKRPKRLPDEIAQSIISAIEDGQLKPGDRLPTEHALAQKFGVARTVVREAISLLKYDGVIRARQGVGAFISGVEERTAFRISPACFDKRKQLVQFLQLRTGVQADASGLAAELRSDAQLAEIESNLASMYDAIRAGDDGAEQRVDAESAFYRAITEASGNEYYVEFIAMVEARLMEELRSVVVKNAKVAEWGESILNEHRAVFEAIKDCDATLARKTTRLHFERAAHRLIVRADFADI